MSNRIRGPINILLLGETQSGKSTFAEALKLYADSNYKIQEGLIGNGTSSQTTDVREDTIHTNLPVFGVYNESSKLIAHEKSIVHSRDDYEDLLNQRRGLKRSQIRSGAQMYDFTIIDTPGLNDTYKEDEEHVAKIFSKLQGSRAISLVMVLVANGPFTPSFVSAIKSYIGLFPELDNVLAFVHTKVDYKFLHPGYVQFSKRHEMKKQTLNDLMGRSTFPHFVIDCDLEMAKPIRSCITLNTICKILELAYHNVPVSILPSRMINKTPKMIEVDKIIASRSRSILITTEDTLKFKDEDEGNLLNSIYSYETAIAELDTEIRNNQDLLCSYNTDELVLLHEERFTDELQVFPVSGVKESRFPAQGHQEYKIDKVVQWNRYFAPMIESGGEGTQHWRCIYSKDNSDWSGYYHVKIYVERRNRYSLDIERLSEKLMEQQKELESLRQKMDKHKRQFREERLKIQQLINSHIRQIQLIQLTSATSIKSDIFYKFLEAKAHVGPENQCSKSAEKIYIDLIQDQERNKPLPDKPPASLLSPSQEGVPSVSHDHQQDPPPDFQGLKENTEVPIETPLTSFQTQSSPQSTGIKDKEHDSTAGTDLDEKMPEEREENEPSIANVSIDCEAKVNDPPVTSVEREANEPFSTTNVDADSKAHENGSSAINVGVDCEDKDDSSVANADIDYGAKGNDSSITNVKAEYTTNEPPTNTNPDTGEEVQESAPSAVNVKVDCTEKEYDSSSTNFKAEYTTNEPSSITNINAGSKTQENDDPIVDDNVDREARECASRENNLSVMNVKVGYKDSDSFPTTSVIIDSKNNKAPSVTNTNIDSEVKENSSVMCDNPESDTQDGIRSEELTVNFVFYKPVEKHSSASASVPESMCCTQSVENAQSGNCKSSTQAQLTKNVRHGSKRNHRDHFAQENNNIELSDLSVQGSDTALPQYPTSSPRRESKDMAPCRPQLNERKSSLGVLSNPNSHSAAGKPLVRQSSQPMDLRPGLHGQRTAHHTQGVSQSPTPGKSSKPNIWPAFLKNRRDQ